MSEMLFQKLMERLDLLEKKIENRVSWEDKVSESGIQIAGGPTTVTRYGRMLSTIPLQNGPTSLAIMAVIRRDYDGQISVVDMSQLKLLS